MSDRPLKLLLIDQDPIFRLGLRVALEENPNLQVLSEAQTDTAALQILAELAQQDLNQVNLVVLELGNSRSTSSQQQGLQLCRQLKALYPKLPIFLLSSVQEPGVLLAAKATGLEGYCPKGTPVSELVAAIEEVAAGGSHWSSESGAGEQGSRGAGEQRENSALNTQQEVARRSQSVAGVPPVKGTGVVSLRANFGDSARAKHPAIANSTQHSPLPFAKLRQNWRLSGISHINAALESVTVQLKIPGLPLLDRAVLAGQRRELLAARWLLNRLLLLPQERQQEQQQFIASSQQLPVIPPLSSVVDQPTASFLLSPRALQAALFSTCVTKLQLPLQNLTDEPLEIDILREEKKRELLYLILQKLAQQLDELRIAQITINQLDDLKPTILLDLWQATIIDFFGKFSRVPLGKQNIEVVKVLLQNPEVVQQEILNRIPLLVDLLSYLLFQTDLYIDNTYYLSGSTEAKSQAENLLENLLILVANAVMQPILNYLADVEAIKQNFYSRKLISTRDIERFRNDLSWKYRLNNYAKEAQRIFESRYELFVLASRGIAKISIYAPRRQELAQLSGIPLLVTLIIEFRDAIAPRLRSLLSFVGSGIVFVLTQVIGRGLGLIGRGILQGIGSVSLQEKNFKRNDERPK
ncbi:regulator [Nostoc minutum NIES-26]|uniref:Regulator n=1 Tax=Nostoc minutum NIES-26 TaxID=1844469 RepID=A0A367RVT6_9NOSO|nr:regulator [Nostoc minutum NIES-26]